MVEDDVEVLDLFCCSGGAGAGYARAGFTVTGVDIVNRPRYPHRFVKADALEYLAALITSGEIRRFALVHSSPPCQAGCALTVGTNASRGWGGEHVQLIPALRELLDAAGLPYVIEQPDGRAPVRRDLRLCGEMFDLGVLRHRNFELGGWSVAQPAHPRHRGYVRGHRHGVYRDGPYVAAYGNGGGKATVPEMQLAMGIDWTDVREELTEAIPPAYTEWIGRQFMSTLREDDMSDESKTDKPKGECSGCGFSYTLGQGKGEFKGELVTRKHLSRTGPGECSGSRRPPKGEEVLCEEGPECSQAQGHTGACDGAATHAEGCTEEARFGPSVCAGCDDPEGHARAFEEPAAVDSESVADDPNASRYEQDDNPGTVTSLTFADPAPAPQELPPVSGQPEPDRDRWGRYLITGVGHTRATSFAKLGSSTFALGEWNERMLIKGLAERPDLIALAHGLDVKRDRKQLNQIADDAQAHAGNKVAANIGTAYHSFTERLDAGLMTLEEVPEQYRLRCGQYVAAMRECGLTTRPEWIERTTAVRADQVSAPVPVAGTLDRILQLPNDELVIGDLKTGSDLSYSWSEIAVQLAVYAHGVNTFGLFDWNTKTWGRVDTRVSESYPPVQVRTDYAIVMHLPADGNGCTLYRVDLVKGWEYAQVSGLVQSRQKDKSVAGVLVPGSLAAPAPQPEHMIRAREAVGAACSADDLGHLMVFARDSGKFSDAELDTLRAWCAQRWTEL